MDCIYLYYEKEEKKCINKLLETNYKINRYSVTQTDLKHFCQRKFDGCPRYLAYMSLISGQDRRIMGR